MRSIFEVKSEIMHQVSRQNITNMSVNSNTEEQNIIVCIVFMMRKYEHQFMTIPYYS